MRQRAVLLGFVVVGVGVLTTILAFALRVDGWSYFFPIATIGIGIFRIRRGMAIPVEAEAELMLVEDTQTRGPQVAGRACVQCKKKVLGEADGKVCKRCDAVIHRSCARAHKRGCAVASA